MTHLLVLEVTSGLDLTLTVTRVEQGLIRLTEAAAFTGVAPAMAPPAAGTPTAADPRLCVIAKGIKDFTEKC